MEEYAEVQVFSPNHGRVQQRNLHVPVRLVTMRRIDGGKGCLRRGRDDDGQECKEQCAEPNQGDDRQFGSQLHWFCLYPIGELSCHKA